MISSTARFYREDVTLEMAAIELGYESGEPLRDALRASPRLLADLAIQARLMQDHGRISREEWEAAFVTAATRLKQGAAVRPLPDLIK
jgi:hypothetical protein